MVQANILGQGGPGPGHGAQGEAWAPRVRARAQGGLGPFSPVASRRIRQPRQWRYPPRPVGLSNITLRLPNKALASPYTTLWLPNTTVRLPNPTFVVFDTTLWLPDTTLCIHNLHFFGHKSGPAPRQRLTLSQDGATASRKLFEYLLGIF